MGVIIKINFDATFQSDTRTSTSAIITKDHKGDYIGAATYLFNDVVDAFVAEARAPLIRASENWWWKVILAMEGRRSNRSGSWVDEIPVSVQRLMEEDRRGWVQRQQSLL